MQKELWPCNHYSSVLWYTYILPPDSEACLGCGDSWDLFVVGFWKSVISLHSQVLFNFRFCFIAEQKQGDIRERFLPSSGRLGGWEHLLRSHLRKDDGS